MCDWGAIFDWDGVVIDSSRQHERSWELLAAELGKPLPEDHFKQGFGRKNTWIIPHLLQWTAVPSEIALWGARKEALYRELVHSEGLETLPGVRDLLSVLRQAGVPCAIGSSTPRANLETIVGRLGLEDFFQAVVCAEDVSVGKPDPEVFVLAARRIGRAPRRCVVFEDAHVGLEAARAGGMVSVGVATTHEAASLVGADWVVRSLEEVSVELLAELLERGSSARPTPMATP